MARVAYYSIRGLEMRARTRSDLAFLSGLILDVKPNGSHSFLMGTCAGHRRNMYASRAAHLRHDTSMILV